MFSQYGTILKCLPLEYEAEVNTASRGEDTSIHYPEKANKGQ